MKSLSQLWQHFGQPCFSKHDKPLGELRLDSRLVGKGDVFCALTAEQSFLDDAINRGADVIVTEASFEDFELPKHVVVLKVNGLGDQLPSLAQFYYGLGSRQPQVIAVTGTNGKSSTVFYLAHFLHQLGHQVATIGTLGIGRWPNDSNQYNAILTTPDIFSLYQAMKQFEQEGVDWVVMEVSSHALDQNRLGNIQIHTALLTHISQDHLDYHGSMANYAKAKLKLFQRPLQCAVLNGDDDYCHDFKAACNAKDCITYFPSELDQAGGESKVVSIVNSYQSLVGFQRSNLMAVITTLDCLGFDLASMAFKASELPEVPGRFQRILNPHGPEVIIDYAHTPDALEKLLIAAKMVVQGRLFIVFGCGGGRDQGKRAMMGEIAFNHADQLVISSDNSRFEAPQSIVDDILSGINYQQKVAVILDRKQAIHWALDHAGCEDLVVLAGKGHEKTMDILGQKVVFDEVEIVMAYRRDHV